MSNNALAAESRDQTGKGVARKLRATGRIPAVLYGSGISVSSLSVDPTVLGKVLQESGAGRNTLISLSVGSDSHTVLLKELQRDPVSGQSLHADFMVVDLQAKVEVTVQLHFVGKAPGVELDAGILDQPVRELLIECLPNAIPVFIDVDMSTLQLGETIHVHQVPMAAGLLCKNEPDLAVAICVVPRAVEEPVEAEVVEGAEGAEAPDADAAEDGDDKPAS